MAMKPFLMRRILVGALMILGCTAQGQIAVYSFGTAGSPTAGVTSVASNLTASAFSGNLGTPGPGGTSPLYTAGSGGGYFAAASWTGAAPGSNYFEFTLTPNAGYAFTTTSMTFGYRATSTGPTNLAVRSSFDTYATNLASGTITGDSVWRSSGTLTITLSGMNTATTFRIFGSGASSGVGTFRVDDVTVNGSVTAIPEPSTYAVILGAMALTGAIIRRRRRTRTA
jgi:hypothetical protein